MNALLFCFLFVGIIGSFQANASIEVNRQNEFPSIILTYNDLSILVENLNGQLNKANGLLQKNERESVSLLISSGEDTIISNGWERITEIKGLPNPGRSLRFRYSRFDAPVSSVEITLTDSSRTISVTGADGSQVNGIYAYLKDKISQHTTYIGGSRVRIYGGMAIVCFPMLILILFSSADATITIRRTHLPIFIAALLSPYVLLLVLPWSDWLPGFAIFSGSASFLDRNINVISLVGVFATFAIPILMYVGTRMKKT